MPPGPPPPPPPPAWVVDPSLVPSLPAACFASLLALLAYLRLGTLLLLAVVAGTSVAYLSDGADNGGPANAPLTAPPDGALNRGRGPAAQQAQASAPPPRTAGEDPLAASQRPPADSHYAEPVFLNHALERLWPCVNTELFAPVLDLLEDVMQGEVPPMVHSVRVESLELGKAPATVHWLRPLTDDEWAAGLRADGAGVRTGKLADRGLADEDEVEGGDYANFEIAFSLDTSSCAPMDKAGLLIAMGVGLRGLGGVEVPVFVDLLRMSGTLRLRLLLDPSPPFVRTGTFTFPKLPEIKISAAPLKRHGRGSLNAMKIPGLMAYVLSCMNRVAKGFVTPEAWSMDLDTLLAGEEAPIRTKHIGVLHVKLHRAHNLRAADPNGFSDPYCVLSWWKQLDKPLFSTRTLLRTLNPVWEEHAFVLVGADAVETGEKLVCQVYDSDRFNSDDALGSVELDLADLVMRGDQLHADPHSDPHALDERRDALADRRGRAGKRGQGELEWAVRFYPLWRLRTTDQQKDAEDASREQGAAAAEDADGNEASGAKDSKFLAVTEKGNIEKPERNLLPPLYHPPSSLEPGSLGARLAQWVGQWAPERFGWEEERLRRRKENVQWLAGKRAVELEELKARPSMERRTGILQWNIIQCQDLQIRPTSGGFEKSHRSKAGGAPALAELTDAPEGDVPAPVSAYGEVILNDRLTFRTRTKARQSSPYFNATAERFVRDWTTEHLTVVIRDERDRERDAIVGVVDFPTLADCFTQSSAVTRWYPLRGGLGWGIVRISFLWKAIDITLPRGVSGHDIASVSVRAVKALELASSVSGETLRATSVAFETEADSQTVSSVSTAAVAGESTASLPLAQAQDDGRSERSGASSSTRVVTWDLPSPVVLAAKYRLSAFLVIKFFTRSGGIKKRNSVWAIGMLRMGDVPDNDLVDVGVPLYATSDVNEAAMLAVTPTEPDTAARQVGTAFISLRISPGLGKVHQPLVKTDRRFASVDEAKQVIAQLQRDAALSKPGSGASASGGGHDRTGSLSSHFSLDSAPRSRLRGAGGAAAGGLPAKLSVDGAGGVPASTSMDSIRSGDEDGAESDDEVSGRSSDEEDEEEENDDFYLTRERDPKLFHEGISSHKTVRSGRWARDKVKTKLSGFSLKHKRQEGAARRVEKETISSM